MRSIGYKLNTQQKKQLTRNVMLMVLTLFTLVCCVVAWFTSSIYANVNHLNMEVERADVRLLSEITKIEFPCATNLGDCTKQEFVNHTSVEKVYYLNGTEPLHVKVDCEGAGMLAYVCPTVSGDAYFDTMISELKTATKKSDPTTWTYEDLQTALDTINTRRVGETATFNGEACTAIRVIYWVAYTDGAQADLEVPGYWYSDYVGPSSGKSDYYATITFTL